MMFMNQLKFFGLCMAGWLGSLERRPVHQKDCGFDHEENNNAEQRECNDFSILRDKA